MSENTHLRENKGKTYEEIYGINKANVIKKKRSVALAARRANIDLEKKRVEAHKRTWILKMSTVYSNIFELLDVGLRQYEIIAKLHVSQDTIRKAVKNRIEIEEILNEN